MNPPGGQTESDLLRRAAAGEEDAFLALYQQFQGPVFRFALHMVGSTAIAEDVTQEVFMTLIEKRSRFDASRGSLRSYLIGMARHFLSRRFERDHKYVSFPDAESPESAVPAAENSIRSASVTVPPTDLVRNETIERVRLAVISLPPDFREAVVLCELQEFSYEDAAEILGCPIGTVRSRLNRARALLAQKLRAQAAPAPRTSAAAFPRAIRSTT